MNEIISFLEEDNACQAVYFKGITDILNKELSDYSIIITTDYNHLPESKYKKIVFLICEDGKRGVMPYLAYTDVVAVFRFYSREWGSDSKRVFPIPIGYNCRSNGYVMERMYPEKKMSERKYDIFYSGQPLFCREQLVERLEMLKSSFNVYSQITSMFRNGLNIDDYYRMLGDSKICVVPNGTSSDTFRYQEACGSGCIVITTTKPNFWYYHYAPVFFIDDWSELTQGFINNILSQDIEKLRIDTLDYYEKCLSEQAVAKYILRCLK